MGKQGGWEVKKYRVRLGKEEQEELKALVSRGRAAAYKQTHAAFCCSAMRIRTRVLCWTRR